MGYYGYHQKIKQRIRAGELCGLYYDPKYKSIGEALVLVFSTPPFKRPIRPYRWAEYWGILEDWRNCRDSQ